MGLRPQRGEQGCSWLPPGSLTPRGGCPPCSPSGEPSEPQNTPGEPQNTPRAKAPELKSPAMPPGSWSLRPPVRGEPLSPPPARRPCTMSPSPPASLIKPQWVQEHGLGDPAPWSRWSLACQNLGVRASLVTAKAGTRPPACVIAQTPHTPEGHAAPTGLPRDGPGDSRQQPAVVRWKFPSVSFCFCFMIHCGAFGEIK